MRQTKTTEYTVQLHVTRHQSPTNRNLTPQEILSDQNRRKESKMTEEGPIVNVTASLFKEAIRDLPLPNLYAKVSEIQNSIAHLHRSNDEMRSFITESCETEEDKQELQTYISDNERVFVNMTERIKLLKEEVERRGQRWIEISNGAGANGDSHESTNPDQQTASSGTASAETGTQAQSNGAGGEDEAQSSNEEGQGGIYL